MPCLHEFGHALAARYGGDRTIANSGYFTLDPFRYAHPLLAVVLPVIFIAMGGFAFPGTMIIFDRSLLHSRQAEASVAGAGPAATLLMTIVFGLVFFFGYSTSYGSEEFYEAAAYLCFLQATSLVVNLLPIPGLDGFAMIRLFLPPRTQDSTDRIAADGVWVPLLILLSIPAIGNLVVQAGFALSGWLGVPHDGVVLGHRLFAFWNGGHPSTIGPVTTAAILAVSYFVLKTATMIREGTFDRRARRRTVIGLLLLAAAIAGSSVVYDRYLKTEAQQALIEGR